MSSLIQGQTTKKNLQLKQFGYILSAIFLILTVTAMLLESRLLPWIFLFTMYVLSGSLWMPVLIKPLYYLLGRHFFPVPEKQVAEKEQIETD